MYGYLSWLNEFNVYSKYTDKEIQIRAYPLQHPAEAVLDEETAKE